MGFYVVQFLTGLSSASALFLVASGLSIIFGVTRVVNFAHGSLYMLGAFIGYSLVSVMSGMIGFWVSVFVAAVVVGLVAVLIEVLILRRVYQAPELFQLVATFGPILIIQDVALDIWGPEDLFSVTAPGLDGAIMIMGTAMPEYDLALIVLSFVVLGGLWLLFNRTRWGTLVRAATEDRDMVGALGVNQTWLFTATFFLGSFLAGLGGAAQLPKGGAMLIMDFEILAPIFVVVVVGGMGSIAGAFVAALLISELNAFGILVWPESTLGLMFVVMAVVLILRPWGLFGKPEALGQHGQVGPPDQPYRPLSRKANLAFLAVLAMLLLLPLMVSDFSLVLIMDMVILSLFAASIHFLMGPGGMVSFGHAAFFGGGAYSAALMFEHFNTPMEIAFFMGPIGAGILALAIGWFCVRRSGVYLAMLTLAFAQVAWAVSFQWGEVTGGDDGIIGVWPSAWASSKVAYYYLTLFFGIGGILVLRRTLFTPFGYAMRACRDSALRSASIGINIFHQQWLAFAFSGALAGLAGALFVYSKGSIFPDELSLPRSFDGLIMVLLGGVKTLTGPVAGASAFTWLDDVISRLDYWRAILGSMIILIVLAFPQGISGFFRERFGGWFDQGESDN